MNKTSFKLNFRFCGGMDWWNNPVSAVGCKYGQFKFKIWGHLGRDNSIKRNISVAVLTF